MLKISIITPSFNSGESIKRAIESVRAQDYPCWEHIVVDGLSTDGTQKILEQYPHITWISEKDAGQADAMNKGFALSTGDIIVYCNADDFFYPGAFSSVIKEFENGADFVVGNILVKSERLGQEFLNTPRTTLQGMMRHWEPNAFCHNPVGYFYKRVVQQACPFNLTNDSTMDLEFLLDAAAKFSFSKVDSILGCYMDGLGTKTDKTQREDAYWRVETFPYVEKHVDQAFSPIEAMQYRKDRLEGYASMLMQTNLRLRWEKQCQVKPSDLSVGVVLQVTGYHSHGVGKAFVEGFRDLNALDRMLAPRATWGASALDFDDGLEEYLKSGREDILFLPGFDWHSQLLHQSPHWRELFSNSKKILILYVQESISNAKDSASSLYDNFFNAASLADGIIYTDILDAEVIRETGKPSMYLPFCVDTHIFNPLVPFKDRKNRAFFRGKINMFSCNAEYRERREYLKALQDADLIDFVPFSEEPLSAEALSLQYNEYKIAVNFPSVFSGHPSRVYEGLGCGCVMVTAKTGEPLQDDFFEDRKDVLYYHDSKTLVEAVQFAMTQPEAANAIAASGRKKVEDRFSSTDQAKQILEFAKQLGGKQK